MALSDNQKAAIIRLAAKYVKEGKTSPSPSSPPKLQPPAKK